jgi:uncharacterized protein DUF4365
LTENANLATKKSPLRGKTRTRQHVIADLSFNHFARHVLECGHVAEPVFHDYGYDVIVFTFTEQGELEPGHILVQLKATDTPKMMRDGKTVCCEVDRRDLKVWLRESAPVILVVYDAMRRRAYWLNVQKYFSEVPTKQLFSKSGSMTVRISLSNRVNRRAIRMFAADRDETLR